MTTPQLNALVAQLSILLGITDTDFLQTSIPLIAESINTYCNRILYKQTGLVDKFRTVGWIKERVYLRQFPVTALTSVTEDGVVLVRDTDFFLSGDDGILLRTDVQGNAKWWLPYKVVVVTFDAGYDPYPADLVPVLAAVVEHEYAKKAQRDLNSGSNMEGVSKLTIFDVGSVEMSDAGPFQSDTSDVHPVLGNYTLVLDHYRSPGSTQSPHASVYMT